MSDTHYCTKCTKTMSVDKFYKKKDGSCMDLCKNCLTMHIDIFDQNSFTWIMEKMDIPFVPWEWNATINKEYEKNPDKVNCTALFGKYVSKMKLKQWKDYGWEDGEKIIAEREASLVKQKQDEENFAARLKEQYENNEISEYEYKTLSSVQDQEAERKKMQVMSPQEIASKSSKRGSDPNDVNFYNESQFMSEDELPDPASELTKEDKVYLALKWGRLYKPNEWVELEKKYNEFIKAFSIQDPDSESALILICKTYLKMSQAIDCGDIESYGKLSRTYEAMRKSAKFTAAQNKEQKSREFDSIGQLVIMCERDGFIPRFATDIPQDKVDFTLRDMNNYIRTLVTEDLGFGQQIEDTIKKIQLQQEADKTQEFDFGDEETTLSDEDIIEHYEAIAADKEKDQLIYYDDERVFEDEYPEVEDDD